MSKLAAEPDTAVDAPERAATDGEPNRSDERADSTAKRRGLIILAILLVITLLAVAVMWIVRHNSQPAPDAVAVTVGVPITGVKLPKGTTIGVIRTQAAGVTPGNQWEDAAEGAVVARERLAMGGADIELLHENDRGSASGAAAAVEALAEQGVSGIVWASSGPHLMAGLAAAEAAGIPVILPYAPVPERGSHGAFTGVWSLAPTEVDIANGLSATLRSYDRPLHIDAGEPLPDGVEVAETLEFAPNGDSAALAREIAWQVGASTTAERAYESDQDENRNREPIDTPADVIIVSGHPLGQANVIHAIQTHRLPVPIVVTPSAPGVELQQALAQQGGTVSAHLRTVGYDVGDAVALSSSPQGRATSAYLTAARQVAADDSIRSLAEDGSFADVATSADSRAHDAVLALTYAASRARSPEPTDLGQALSSLALAAGEGVAGTALNFAQPQAADSSVTLLHATTQELGLRPLNTSDTPSGAVLVWIADPDPTDTALQPLE